MRFVNDAGIRHRNPTMLHPHRVPASLLLIAALVSVGAVLAPAAQAQPSGSQTPAKKHRVVIYTEGGRGAEVTKLYKDALPTEGVEYVSEGDFKAALAKQTQRTPLGVTITMDSKRQQMLSRIGKAAASLQADIVLIGYVRLGRAGQEVLVLGIEPDKDTPTFEKAIPLGKSATDADVKTTLADVAEKLKPVAEPEVPGGGDAVGGGDAAPKPDPSPRDEDAWVRPQNVSGHEIFNIGVSFDVGFRFFGYNDTITTNLRDYSVKGAPGIGARAEVYPMAPTGILVLRDIGVVGSFRIALGLSSETPAGDKVDTQWLHFGGGLRYRLPLGPKEKPFVLGLRGTFEQDSFTLDTEDPLLLAEVPSVKYTYLRVGLDGRFPIGPVAITAFGGYRGAFDSGEVFDRFRDSSIGGIDVGGGLSVPIVYGLEAHVQAEYIRWFYAFAPIPGDAFVAGGALDEYVHIEIGPQYVF